MLANMFGATAAALRETYNGVAAVAEYVYDDVMAIPEAVEKGLDEGLFTKEPEATTPESDAPVATTPTETPTTTPRTIFE